MASIVSKDRAPEQCPVAQLDNSHGLKKNDGAALIISAVAICALIGLAAVIGGSTLLAFSTTPLEYAGGLTLLLLGLIPCACLGALGKR